MVVFLLLVLGGGGYYYFSRGKAAEPVSIPALNQPAETEVPLQEESSDSPVANPQDTEADFTKEGNLIDARGTVGSWVILYEEPGSPAVQTVLEFTAQSQCNLGSGWKACDTGELVRGDPIMVTGKTKTNVEAVEVITLEKL